MPEDALPRRRHLNIPDPGTPPGQIARGRVPGGTFEALDDGLLGDLVGYVRFDSKRQKVKHSDLCPGCKHKFADTIADQLDPQQALF